MQNVLGGFVVGFILMLMPLRMSESQEQTCSKSPSVRDAVLCLEKKIEDSRNRSLASGMVAFFALPTCPLGWTAEDNARGRYIVGVNAPGELGARVGTALSDKENRAAGPHTHNYKDHYTAHNPKERYEGLRGAEWDGSGNPGFGKITMTTALSDGPAGTNAPYIQLLPCKKQ